MLNHVQDRVIISVDVTQKNTYQFGNGQILVMFPNTNQLDRRYHAPVSGTVISAEDIPVGVEVLVEHNSCHVVNEIVDLKDDNPNIKFYSVPKLECFAWRLITNEYTEADLVYYFDGLVPRTMLPYSGIWSEWQPTKYYAIGERVYEPYTGILQNIKPTRIKNTLLIKTGEFKDKIVHIIKNGEYTIIYQDTNGKPNELLVTFHVEDESELSDPILNAKQEILAVSETLTQRYHNGELLTGLTEDNCKPIETTAYAD